MSVGGSVHDDDSQSVPKIKLFLILSKRSYILTLTSGDCSTELEAELATSLGLLTGGSEVQYVECATFGIKMFAAFDTPVLITSHILEALSNVAKHCLHILPSLSINNCTREDVPLDRNSASISDFHNGTTWLEAAVRSSLFPLPLVTSHPHPRQKTEFEEAMIITRIDTAKPTEYTIVSDVIP